MIVKNSIRQLLRTPLKTSLFILLLIAASTLFSLGGYLWILNSKSMKSYENTFTTIGTVEQRATTVKEEKVWDAYLKDYRIISKPEYNEILPISILNFKGANYISNPERRCYYGAYDPEYNNDTVGHMDGGIIVEVTPVKNCIPDRPVKLLITKVLYGNKELKGANISFCNHFDPNPERLIEGKTYVMSLREYPHSEKENTFEFVPNYVLKTSQVDSIGNRVEDGIADDYFCEEVSQGFYKTKRGKRWKELVKANAMRIQTIPVTPTDNTKLYMPFYNGDIYIRQGHDFTKDEYRKGSKVCLISDDFAWKNNCKIGDSVHLYLYYACYESSPGGDFPLNGNRSLWTMLNANGEVYPAFEDSNYIITGIYDISSGARTGVYGIGKNEVIIPKSSVKNSDKDNILAYEPMMGYNTSFQIPNGQIETYLTAWEKVGIKKLEFTFYDKGYSQLSAGMKNMKIMSRILFIAGLVMVIAVLIFFNNILISKQRKRIAIERSLGFSKRQCIRSLLSGIVILIILCSMIGCTVGAIFTFRFSTEAKYKSYYDITYGNVAVDNVIEDMSDVKFEYKFMVTITFGMIVIISLIGIFISFIMIFDNLKQEPIELLVSGYKE